MVVLRSMPVSGACGAGLWQRKASPPRPHDATSHGGGMGRTPGPTHTRTAPAWRPRSCWSPEPTATSPSPTTLNDPYRRGTGIPGIATAETGHDEPCRAAMAWHGSHSWTMTRMVWPHLREDMASSPASATGPLSPRACGGHANSPSPQCAPPRNAPLACRTVFVAARISPQVTSHSLSAALMRRARSLTAVDTRRAGRRLLRPRASSRPHTYVLPARKV